jgi:hypothetical protein
MNPYTLNLDSSTHEVAFLKLFPHDQVELIQFKTGNLFIL